MACFLVPAAEAIAITVVLQVVKKREKEAADESTQRMRVKWNERLRWLNGMLWGGSMLLALEHVWHGEIVPWPPFLTAIETPGEVGPMLRELATYGVAMAVAVTVIWGIMVVITERKAKATSLPEAEKNALIRGA